jgi:hypothetical protein
MNIPKEAIEKAIEGGWCKNYGNGKNAFWFSLDAAYVKVKVTGPNYPTDRYTFAEVALDPSFWRSLENATGKTARAAYLDFCAANWDAETDTFWSKFTNK